MFIRPEIKNLIKIFNSNSSEVEYYPTHSYCLSKNDRIRYNDIIISSEGYIKIGENLLQANFIETLKLSWLITSFQIKYEEKQRKMQKIRDRVILNKMGEL
jgi:hypothetical protein